MKALYPVTITAKFSETRDFYKETFNFSTIFEADWYVQLRHETSGVELGIMKPNLSNQPQQLHEEYSRAGIIYTLEVKDVAQEYARIQALPVDIFYPLTSEAWGQTHFMLTDPAGVTIDVVQQVG